MGRGVVDIVWFTKSILQKIPSDSLNQFQTVSRAPQLDGGQNLILGGPAFLLGSVGVNIELGDHYIFEEVGGEVFCTFMKLFFS